jgi:hypothetical protein
VNLGPYGTFGLDHDPELKAFGSWQDARMAAGFPVSARFDTWRRLTLRSQH